MEQFQTDQPNSEVLSGLAWTVLLVFLNKSFKKRKKSDSLKIQNTNNIWTL